MLYTYHVTKFTTRIEMITLEDIASEEWKIEILETPSKDIFQINAATDIEEMAPLIFHRDEMENIASICHQFTRDWDHINGEFE
jgi:hypothetical protein